MSWRVKRMIVPSFSWVHFQTIGRSKQLLLCVLCRACVRVVRSVSPARLMSFIFSRASNSERSKPHCYVHLSLEIATQAWELLPEQPIAQQSRKTFHSCLIFKNIFEIFKHLSENLIQILNPNVTKINKLEKTHKDGWHNDWNKCTETQCLETSVPRSEWSETQRAAALKFDCTIVL